MLARDGTQNSRWVVRPTGWVDRRRLAVEVGICESMRRGRAAQGQDWQEMRERQPHCRFI